MKSIRSIKDIDFRSLVLHFLVLVTIAAVWEVSARLYNNKFMLPTFIDTISALLISLASADGMGQYMLETMKSLTIGFAVGTGVAFLVTAFASTTRVGTIFLSVTTAMFSTVPAVALFPIISIFCGIGMKSIIATAAIATVFPVAVAMHKGFESVPGTLRDVGRTMGMNEIALAFRILTPGSLVAILAGLRSGFSGGMRAQVSVELIVGAVGAGKGGIGFYMLVSKNNMDINELYAAVILIMIVGLAIELGFNLIEEMTVRKWGMIK